MIASEEFDRVDADDSLFSPLASVAIMMGGALVFFGLLLSVRGSRTVLLTPVDAQLRAGLIAVGVFAGVWTAAVIREFWRLDIASDLHVPRRVPVAAQLLAVVAAGGWCGFALAGMTTEWFAFHGLEPSTAQESFTVTDVSRPRRGSGTLTLAEGSGAPSISVGCEVQDCRGLRAGDRLLVRIETGRGGARRAVFPRSAGGRAARG